MMGEHRVQFEVVDRVATLTLDRPERRNALDDAMIEALNDATTRLASDREARVVVVAGSGRGFCAGADIEGLAQMQDGAAFAAFVQRLTDAFDRLRRLPQPVIAAVHGVAFGGGFELVLACDLRVVDRTAKLGLPEIRLGLLPGAAGTQRLPRTVPPAIAKELLLTGDPLDLDRALQWGVVNRVVDQGEHLTAARDLAARLVEGPPEAMAAATRLVDDGLDLGLHAAIDLERRVVAGLFDGSERVEGVTAFLDKRPPAFG